MVINYTQKHPLQSREWGEFRNAWGNETIWTKWGLITIHKIPFTNYKIGMFIKGPMPTKEMLSYLVKLAKEKKIIFIKLEPNYVIKKGSIGCADKDKVVKLLKESGAVIGKTLFTPTSFWIDLNKSDEQLLESFTSKTRYNIRLAQKHGVTINEDNSDKAFNKYLQLTRETVQRQGFFAHTKRYHRLMWKYLGPQQTNYQGKQTKDKKHNQIAHLLVARYKNEVITTWILFSYKDFLYYPYGASSEIYKNVMANNLMMWEAIRFGKSLGLKTFDLWGREPGKGFTKFKEGYNPYVVEFLGTWDLVINKPQYYVYRSVEYLRWKMLKIPAKLGLIKPRF